MDAPKNIPFSRTLPWMAGGVGLAALENKYLGDNLPPELQKINLAIGGTTGALMAMPSNTARIAALSGIPLKEGLLFGVGGMEKFRKQQEDLTNTNLATAKLNRSTALVQRRGAGTRAAMTAAFLIPALAAGGGVAWLAYQNAQKRKAKAHQDELLAQKGPSSVRRKVRIDIPATAFPKDFWSSLRNVDDDPRSRTRVMGEGDGEPAVQPRFKTASVEDIIKAATDHGMSVPGMVGNFLWESTGVPSFQRAGTEAVRGVSNLSEGDYHNTARYGLSSAANAALGLVALRLGVLPVAGKVLGKARLGNWARSGVPFSRFAFRHAFGHQLGPLRTTAGGIMSGSERMAQRAATGLSTKSPLNRLIESQSRYDPKRFAWNNPTPATWDRPLSGAFNRFLTQPATLPTTRLGHLALAGRKAMNRVVDTGYRAKQMVGRYPNAALTIAGTYPASQGVLRDDYEDAMRKKEMAGRFPRWNDNKGFYGMPVSSMAAGLLSGLGGPNSNQPFMNQISR